MPLKQYFVCQAHPLAVIMSTMKLLQLELKFHYEKTRVPLGVPLHTPGVRVPHLRTTALLNWPDLSSGGFMWGSLRRAFVEKCFKLQIVQKSLAHVFLSATHLRKLQTIRRNHFCEE